MSDFAKDTNVPANDCISRQDAIDEIKEIYEYHDTVTEDRIIDHLKRLPSVEKKVVMKMEAVATDLAFLPIKEWTPVTEGLPDKDVPVLVYLFGDSPYIAWINRDGEWETEEFIIDCDFLPKAWFPLPEPCKEEEL